MADNSSSPSPSRQSQRSSVSTATPPDSKGKDFCEIAIERGYCTAEQIKRAQDDLRRQNSSEEISAYLIRLGIITQQHARACERGVNGPTIIAGFEILEKVG